MIGDAFYQRWVDADLENLVAPLYPGPSDAAESEDEFDSTPDNDWTNRSYYVELESQNISLSKSNRGLLIPVRVVVYSDDSVALRESIFTINNLITNSHRLATNPMQIDPTKGKINNVDLVSATKTKVSGERIHRLTMIWSISLSIPEPNQRILKGIEHDIIFDYCR